MMYLVRTYPDKLNRNDRGRFDRLIYGYKKVDKRYKEPKTMEREGLVELGSYFDNIGTCNFIIDTGEIDNIKNYIVKFGNVPFKIFEIKAIYEHTDSYADVVAGSD